MRTVRTRRLVLDPMVEEDAEALRPILADPRMWAHAPHLAHTSEEQTRDYCRRAAARWATDGLSYWTVCLATTSEVVGSGGVQVQRTGEWNLNYRVAVAHQGSGLAVELGRAGISAATRADPGRPVVAWVLPHHRTSRGVAARLELEDRGLRRSSEDDVPRHAYADRPLDDAVWPPAGD